MPALPELGTGRSGPIATPSALLLDLDGTLLDAADQISERTVAAVRAASMKIPVAIASGRVLEDVSHFARLIGFHGPQISDNGSRLLDAITGRTVYELPIDEMSAREIIAQLEQDGIGYFAVDSGCTVRSSSLFRTWQITVITCAVSCRSEAEDRALAHAGGGVSAICSIGSRDEWYVNYTHHDANKGHAARLFSDQAGVDIGAVMAIGDGLNDLHLLDAVGIPVAMGHAIAEVKSRAVHVTGTIGEDGVAQAIEQFIL